tara:strand:- start:47 stop:328 length:282 start_codon:yes stop_codon:yes gene_type:complete
MAKDYIEYNVVTGEKIVREHTQAEKDAINAAMPTTEQKWAKIRIERNALLHETDWASLADSPAISDAMKTYRQDLRDIPSQSDVDNITWPDKP